MAEVLLVERRGDIATVTLNRPEKLNALTKTLWKRLGDAMDELSADDRLRCIVLRGAGDKSFSPGNDISEFVTERPNAAQARAYGVIHHATLRSLYQCRHPLVAMIKGICVGGGLEIAALCDMRICGASSRFGIPVNRLGLVVGPEEMRGLLQLVGKAATLEILLEGRVFDAAEAKDKGLVNRVVADEQVESEAYATARRIADGAPLTARWHKKFLRRLADPTPLTSEEQEESYACYDTQDFQVGYRSFLAKTGPEFHGT